MTRQARWIYRDMMDVYYDDEKPLSLELDILCDQIGVLLEDERTIVERLLRFKFTKTEEGYTHEVCERVIAEYHGKAEIARANGKLGGRPKKTHLVSSGFQSGSDPVPIRNPVATGSQANQEPITINHKPEKSKASASGSRLPADWKPNLEDTEYCKKERPDLRPSLVAQNFYDYWTAQPGARGRKSDWSATWRSWVRKETAGSGTRAGQQQQQTFAEQLQNRMHRGTDNSIIDLN